MARQFKPGFQFNMDSCFGFPTQDTQYPLTSTSFSSDFSYNPFTPTSHLSTPHGLSAIGFGHPYNNVSQSAEVAPPLTMGDFMFDTVIDMKLKQTSFDYKEMNMGHCSSTGSLTPLNSDLYDISPEAVISTTSFMKTPSRLPSGSEADDIYLPWSQNSDSPISFFQKEQFPSNYEKLDIDHQSVFPYHVRDSTSPKQMRAQQMKLNETQRKTTELQYAQIWRARKRVPKPDPVPVEPVRGSCDYPGCGKAFRRKEHLKRHKQVSHGEGPNRFSCEFCGKDQFNRRDNLDFHRKLHARPNSSQRGVKFVADAVLVIEKEKLTQRRRAPPKAKQVKKKRDLEYEADEL
ncbi:hypothetical protein KAF25_007628 [Fusarium avenaceum]|uniref:C2H2-type domain-containing protein n=1 Tax=Fusarium avenaceum TaxID=40199 RepID=A0A9P7GRF2_9HYPO|nr:hypothetical protein KAF25_007628 [Fusarium avenaceum]